MKFAAFLLAIATVSAIKLQSTSKISLQHEKENDFIRNVFVQVGGKALVNRSCQEWVAWLREEAASDDGLTWDELKAELSKVAAEHNYTPTEADWEQVK